LRSAAPRAPDVRNAGPFPSPFIPNLVNHFLNTTFSLHRHLTNQHLPWNRYLVNHFPNSPRQAFPGEFLARNVEMENGGPGTDLSIYID